MRVAPLVGRASLLALAVSLRTVSGASAQSGASMAETARWLGTEAPPLTEDVITTSFPDGKTLTSHYQPTSFALQDCNLTITAYTSITGGSSWFTVSIVPLGDLDLNTIRIKAIEPIMNGRNQHEDLSLEMWEPAEKGSTIKQNLGAGFGYTNGTSFHVRDRFTGERILAAIKHAAELCGATAPPF